MEDAGRAAPVLTAHHAGLVGCVECGQVHPLGTRRCRRCGSHLSPPDPASLQRVWAWLVAGMIAYVPANAYPMLKTTLFGRTTDNTIIGGAMDLLHHGNYGVAVIILVASVMIPMGKFVVIVWLAIAVRNDPGRRRHARQHLYEVVEFVGRWSMVDVFVVAILSALVQLSLIATVNPGIAAISFALSVAFTMLSAQSFDPRLIWAESEAQTA